ncbi:PASTA domain-containing protein [Proteiniphilum sp. UBA1028]|jgi:beta-lactam-binding protein with PASTA domain|uniref:PASTA domain-containing protein n=1 Tax=Proteiniphilum sp. UBA1028 TaxID=1947251 RepID=UPI0025E8E49E|nr:PASTA domain-containing protein [Proteiniphilum sp. UBA1028]
MTTKKQTEKTIFGNHILKNLLIIIGCGILIIVLALLLLGLYTRHSQNVVVPTLEGLQVNEASTILHGKGLEAQIVDSVYRRDAVPGAILDQTPKAGNKVKEGRSIYITIYSRTPQQVSVPGLVDYSTRQASALLNSLGFTQLSMEEVPAEYSGLVVAVKYRGKTLTPDEKVPAGSPLTLVITSGTIADSLNVDDEYIVAPEKNGGRNSDPQEGAIDNSFF